MEARDSGSNIRPLPVDDIDSGAPQDRQVENKRRWLPLIVIVVGAISFGVVARGLGPTQNANVATASTTAAPISETPEPTTTTTTEPPPPVPRPLRELLPFAADELRLVSMNASSAQIGLWALEDTTADFDARVSQPLSATYNTDGSSVAVHTQVRDGSFAIDSDTDRAIYILGGVTSGAWHPTDPDLFAWTVPQTPGVPSQTLVRIADLSGFSGTSLEPLFEIQLDRETQQFQQLEAWGDWGFATTTYGMTYLFDADGLLLWEARSQFFDATPDGTLLLARSEEGSTMPYLLDADGIEKDLTGLDLGGVDFRITADGEWVLAVTPQADGHTSILARTVHARSTRLTSINETARIVDVVWDDRFIVLQESDSNDLVFKDWDTGAEFRLPVDDVVVDIHL